MRNKMLFVFFIIILIISLSGCWSRKELNELAIVSGLAIDKDDELYKVTAQVINPGEVAGQAQTTRVAVSTYQADGRSIFEAIRKLTKETPRKLYLSHLRVIVVSEDLAEQGIKKALDFLSRDHEVRTDFYILVSKEKNASTILSILTPIEKIPTTKLFTSLEVSESNWAPTKGVHLDDLISKLTSKGVNPVLTGVFITGNIEFGGSLENVQKVPSPTTIKLDHLGAFKGDKLVGWLNEKESKGFNYIVDNVENTVKVEQCEGGNVTVEIYETNTKINVLEKSDGPKIVVEVEADAAIGEVQCQENILKEKKIKELEEKLGKQTEESINEAIIKAKELETDIFGFGEKIHKKSPKLWDKLKDDWNENGFVNLEVEIKAEYHIRRTGTIVDSFQEEGNGD